MRIAVTGGTGFVGSHLVPTLLRAGHEIRVVGRGVRRGALPDDLRPTFGDVLSGEGLAAAFQGAEVVIHLVAVIRERGRQTFTAVNAEGTRQVVEAARAAGVTRLVHLSAIGADPDPTYAYLASKWQGEEWVRTSGLDFVIVRSSVIGGRGDGFFTQLARAVRLPQPVIVIPGDGTALFQPIAADDVVRCLAATVSGSGRISGVVEIGGPEHLSLETLIRRVAAVAEADWLLASPKRFVHVPVELLRPMARLTDRCLPNPLVTASQLDLLARPNITRLDAVASAFGFLPSPLAVQIEHLRPQHPLLERLAEA
ncbi:MAG TPA: NAD-dependent epimerase/dehydratase family protein [Verrucomicrobiae bacterium]|nr:NAD-dependent epimerase/dehydratase family protein [Verrucomicrobiae bacterium]